MAGTVNFVALFISIVISLPAFSWVAPKSRKAKTNAANAANWVQKATGVTFASGTSVATSAFTSPITAGNLIICGTDAASSSVGISSMTDSLGNPYSKAKAFLTGITGWGVEIWYRENHSGGASNVVTATWASSFGSYKSISCHEYSGMLTSGAFDTAVTSTGSDSQMPMPVLKTSSDNEILFFNSDSASPGIAMSGYTRSLLDGNLIAETPAPKAGPYYVTHHIDRQWSSVTATFKSNGSTPAWINAAERALTASAGTIQTAAFGTQPVLGRTIICAVAYFSGQSVSGVADTAGNTYSNAVKVLGLQGNYENLEIWYKTNIATTASFKVTATFTGSGNDRYISCHQFSNIQSSGALDAFSGENGKGGNPTPAAITTTTANQLIFNAVLSTGVGRPDPSFTQHSTLGNNVVQSRYVTAAGQYFIGPGQDSTWTAVLAAFKAKTINPVSHVHTVEGSSFEAGSNTLTLPPFQSPANTKNGNLIACQFTFSLPTGTVATVTDTAGNTYLPAGSPLHGTGGNSGWSTEMYYAENAKFADRNQITWTTSANTSKTAVCSEFTGIATSGALDKTAQASPTSTVSPSAGSVTTTSARQLVLAHHQCTNGSDANSDSEKLSSISGDATMYKIVNSLGVTNLAGTSWSASDCNSRMATFKGAVNNVDAPPIQYIQTTAKFLSGSATGGSVSFPSVPKAGSLILVRVNLWGGSSTISGVSDNNGTSYSVACSQGSGASGGRAAMYYGTVGVSPTSPFTITASGSSNEWSFSAQEYTGVTTLDQSATKAGTPASTAHYSGQTPTTTASDELVASIINWNVTGGVTTTNGYTNRHQQYTNSYPVGQGDERIVSEKGSFQTLWYGFGNTTYDACIATFK